MDNKNPIVTFRFENLNPIVVELFPDKAPNTVKNFITLVKKHYFDGVIFHRVIRNFMIQGGQGGPTGGRIKGEFSANGVPNDLKHLRGVISMARTADPNSATGQFFLMHKDSPHLDHNYAAFGLMISGFDTLEVIATAPTDRSDKPLVDRAIQTAIVDTKGIEYEAPTYDR